MTRYRSFAPSTGALILKPEENEKSEPFSNRKQVRIFLIWWARVDCASRAEQCVRVAAPSGCIVPWAARAPCWPQPQQLLPVSAAGSGRRCCTGAFLPAGLFGGPYELRLPLFPQPLGRALKKRSAAPASPPCFRRRRRSAPLLFESARIREFHAHTKQKPQRTFIR